MGWQVEIVSKDIPRKNACWWKRQQERNKNHEDQKESVK
jgi:hypothetical protein